VGCSRVWGGHIKTHRRIAKLSRLTMSWISCSMPLMSLKVTSMVPGFITLAASICHSNDRQLYATATADRRVGACLLVLV
jgi:hypothetical protein